jgi:NitT/TauT family transport system substrate-binding protein
MIRSPLRTTLLAASLLAFGGAAQAADKVRWLNDWLPAGDKAAIYLGVQKGLFQAQGIEVEIGSARGGGDVITKLATGSAEFGSAGIGSLLQARAQGEIPVVALSPIYTRQPDAVFTTADSGIASIKDLVGKTVATPTFSVSNVTWPLVLSSNGVNPDDVKLLKVDPGAMSAMLATGKVQATLNWITVAPGFEKALKETGKTLKMLPWSDYGFDGYGLSLVASKPYVDAHPDLTARFVKAYRQAEEMAIADPAAAAAALKAMVPEIDEPQAVAQYKASIPLMQNPTTDKVGHLAFDPALLKTTWTWVAKAQNLAPDALDPASVVDARFAK